MGSEAPECFDAFLQMSGGPNLVTMPEGPWKRWRSIFNQGFSPAYMLEQLPKLVNQGQIFCEKLRNHAMKGDLFQLEEATFRLTIDVIGLIGL
jgi:cytochrome P450